MKYRPLLFSAPMVRAILTGAKTQTRRVLKVLPRHVSDGVPYGAADPGGMGKGGVPFACPYGKTGDRLWVRETWAAPHACDHLKPREIQAGTRIHYAASESIGGLLGRPSIFMPRWASRITLELTEVHVERLKHISRGDAMAEGCPFANMADGPDPRQWYAELWNEINGAGSWDLNPYVWCLSFKRIQETKT